MSGVGQVAFRSSKTFEWSSAGRLDLSTAERM